MLEPVHLRTFIEVLECGSFAGAARGLNYTPSAVSHQMALLEAATGLLLFERSPRRVRPTAACSVLAPRSREVLANLAALEREMGLLATGTAGQIRLGSFASAAARILPSALVAFRETYPGVDIAMTEGEPTELVPLLEAGDLDAVLGYRYQDGASPWPPGVRAEALMSERALVLVSSEHPMADAVKAELWELRSATWISIRDKTEGDQALTDLCAAAGYQPHIAYRCNDYSVIRELVKANLGVSIVPELGFEPHPQLRALTLSTRRGQRGVELLSRAKGSGATLPTLRSCLHQAVQGLVRPE